MNRECTVTQFLNKSRDETPHSHSQSCSCNFFKVSFIYVLFLMCFCSVITLDSKSIKKKLSSRKLFIWTYFNIIKLLLFVKFTFQKLTFFWISFVVKFKYEFVSQFVTNWLCICSPVFYLFCRNTFLIWNQLTKLSILQKETLVEYVTRKIHGSSNNFRILPFVSHSFLLTMLFYFFCPRSVVKYWKFSILYNKITKIHPIPDFQ